MKYGELPLAFCKKKRFKIPSIEELKRAPPIGGNSILGAAMVLVPCNNPATANEFVAEVLHWFDDNDVDDGRYCLYGIHGYLIKRYTTERSFKGLSAYFYQHVDAVSLKLSMADRCFDDHIDQMSNRNMQ